MVLASARYLQVAKVLQVSSGKIANIAAQSDLVQDKSNTSVSLTPELLVL